MTEAQALKQSQEYLASLGYHLTIAEVRRMYELMGHKF